MISKELLSKVFNKKILHIVTDIEIIHYNRRSDSKDTEIAIYFDNKWHLVNIYELSHKCKEWIASKYPRFSIKWDIGYVKGTNETVKVWLYNKCIGEDRQEYRAIFQAAQWILENKDK